MGVSWKLSLFSLIGVEKLGRRDYDEKGEMDLATSVKRRVSSCLRLTQKGRGISKQLVLDDAP